MRIKILLLCISLFVLNHSAFAAKEAPPASQFDVSQTVTKQLLADGVTADDAIEAIKSKAIELNMKFVAHQPLSKELNARGVKSGRLEIFQFCNPLDAHKMVKFNPIFAAYMPCRIALVEEDDGKIWLMMINLNMLINNTALPAELKKIATRINDTLVQIMDAGATGEF